MALSSSPMSNIWFWDYFLAKHFEATTPYSHLNNGGAEHDPFGLYVLRVPQIETEHLLTFWCTWTYMYRFNSLQAGVQFTTLLFFTQVSKTWNHRSKIMIGLQSSCHLQRTPLTSAMMLIIDKLRLSEEVQQSSKCRYWTDNQAYPTLLAASQQEQL